MDFSNALHEIKAGAKLTRAGWNGKDQFIFLMPGSVFKVHRPPLLVTYEEGAEINYHGHIDMKNSDNEVVPWFPSQGDMLSDDWEIV